MSYCTLDDLKQAIPEDNLIQLTDDGGIGQVDMEKVNNAIAYAKQLIDGYLRGRYPLPLTNVPALMKHLAVDLAIFYLYARRFELDMPETMVNRHKNAIKLLEQIQKGIIRLGIESNQETGEGYYKSNKTEEDKIFSKTHLKAF